MGRMTGCPPRTNGDGPGCSGVSDSCRPGGVLLGVDVSPARLGALVPWRVDDDRWEFLLID